MRQLQIGLIGCGAAGKIHARAIVEAPDVRLNAVADIDERAARTLGDHYGVNWTVSVDELLDRHEIEAVSIAVPHHGHFELAKKAAQARKAILLEKPFTLDPDQASELIRVCSEAGVMLIPWLERRYLPYADKARAIVAEQVLGKIAYTRISSLGYKPRAYWTHGMRYEEYPSHWRERAETSGGGILIMNAIHQIDLMSYITGLKIVDLFARTATLHHEVEVEDMALVTVRYQGGAMGMIEASCCTYGMGQFPIASPADRIMGDDGNLELGDTLKSFDRVYFQRNYEFPRVSVMEMKIALLEDFYRLMREGAAMRCAANDALAALQVVDAAYRSSKTGLPVEIQGCSGARESR
jgi:UDP-N-acetyl-2-amino-2-deoxyglucuronate dehydrogenase